MITKYPEISKLIEVFQKLPLVGPKTAEKIAYFIIQTDDKTINEIIESIKDVKNNITRCINCFCLTTQNINPCPICIDKNREPIICVVQEFKDQLLIDESINFSGKYHALEGLINPIEGKTPDKLKIKELIERIKKENIREIVFAIPSSIDGDITVEYISEKIKKSMDGIILSRIAVGIPAGSELENIDKITLTNAINNRKKIE